ncbi:U3 small nucleolar RNA-associated protein 14 homolog A [Hyla sarda]|uniref:U3 small nucleolar RNA-associated protein 14 homolog A n=1 Tax=Hyla sarda TaxID=327740 RepID=UPI0024C22E71|nr:U3 small nucleolar RNA-associated protein 14 homolog A [Hyla sarda]
MTPHSSEDSDAERKHQKLLEAIAALSGKKRKKLSERTEAGLQVSEFGISAEGAGEKIRLTDLIEPIKKETSLSKVKKQLNKFRDKKSVELPLSKEETQKIQRVVSYKHTSEEVSKWENVVQENRRAQTLVFPLNDQSSKPVSIEDSIVGWKAGSPLEMEIFSILHKNRQAVTDPLITPMEEASLKAMSVEEAQQRRAELQKARALQSYYESKAHREKKIKSKKYHKLLKKVKKKDFLKKFEELRKTNPDAAMEELERLEKARIQERMSLKHQNSGKWAKSKAIMAKYDDEARKAMQEQLQKNKDLTRKVQVVSDDEDENEEKVDEIIPDFVNEAQMSLEGPNPWMTGKLRSEVKDPGTQEEEETKMEEEVNAKADETEDEEECEDEATLKEFEDRRRLRKELGEQESLEPVLGKAPPDSAAADNAGEVSRFNKLFQSMLEQNKKEKKIQEKNVVEEEEEEPVNAVVVEPKRTEEGPLLIESLERTRTMEDLEALEEQVEEPVREETPLKTMEDGTQLSRKKRTKKSKLIDSNNILPTKERPVQAPLIPVMVEEEEEVEDGETSQKMMIQEAFAGDDVIGDFLKEKRKAEQDAKPKDISLVLPGWGEWGGSNLQVSSKKRRRFTIKAPPAAPRKDQRLPNVIINEKRNVAVAAHLVTELPFPFSSQQHFESTIRAPVGNTWNTERAVQNLTAPKVITKRGHIIDPITEDVFQKHSTAKNVAIELEKPQTKPDQRAPRKDQRAPRKDQRVPRKDQRAPRKDQRSKGNKRKRL